MEHIIAKLLQDFEQVRLTRRQLIQGLALAASSADAVQAQAPATGATPIVRPTGCPRA